MANNMKTMQGCCCGVIVGTCAEFWDFIATKSQLEITLASDLLGGGWFDCTAADCQAVIDGTYILTKIPGSFGSGSCGTATSGRTYSYTFSETLDCATDDDPYTGVAVYFECAGDVVRGFCVYRKTPSGSGGFSFCSTYAYWHNPSDGITLPADMTSGEIPPDSPGAFSSPCVPTSANMPFVFYD